MAKDRSLVRASDIGAWAFCNRAWWLAKVQHAEHENPAVFVRGDLEEAGVDGDLAAGEAERVDDVGGVEELELPVVVLAAGLGRL